MEPEMIKIEPFNNNKGFTIFLFSVKKILFIRFNDFEHK